MSTRIRRATVDDAQTLSTLARATFVESFGHLYEQEDLQAFLDDSYAVEKQAVILGHPDYAVWFLETDGRAVGHCAAGPCGLPHEDVCPGDGEIKRLYILRDFQGGGQGARLMDTAMAWLERDGPRTLWIGVWSENAGAQRFYARYGFEKVGTYGFPVGRVVDLEFILRRPACGRAG
ncbi:GNAT family N-acetyltransferase [Lysobacter humi (ex Lee et al. 2017)]